MKMIYLDKNYPPREIKLTLQAINDMVQGTNTSLRLVALVPDVPKSNNDIPFSTTFLT